MAATCIQVDSEGSRGPLDHTVDEKGVLLTLDLSALPDLMALFILKMAQVHTCFFSLKIIDLMLEKKH